MVSLTHNALEAEKFTGRIFSTTCTSPVLTVAAWEESNVRGAETLLTVEGQTRGGGVRQRGG